ncbi:hypothetical protein H257_18342 [Aphanomyces astaci]|uniref:Uncharacterized protein n=1 Tax=Aphanomyces astaci TaxID=112090 RepID=W4FBF3_APHAT|nr:hypothetical protein H257_18342 [Aphanomyces astaci]ETV64825.1 hypothetical protein H257_18342 [Aphanomyces astaci]|eukprot:XP_009845682.1 hypothetical protein H257_18342 [Aphanomyces astaci]
MALAAESTLGSALEAVDVTLKDDDVLYAKHILDAEKHRERAQAMARAEHQARSVENAYKRSVHDAMVQYERECAQLKKTMVDDILAELKLLRDNRDGVSLVRKGLARSARSSRANVTYTEEPDIDGVQTLASSSAAEFTSTTPTSSAFHVTLSSTRQKPPPKSFRLTGALDPFLVPPVSAAIAHDDIQSILRATYSSAAETRNALQQPPRILLPTSL